VIVKDYSGAVRFRIERPRERMMRAGPAILSDRELLAAVLGSGGPGNSVDRLAAAVLTHLEHNNYEAHPRQLLTIRGLGPAKAGMLAAAIEFGRRVLVPRHYRIRRPSDVVPLLQHYADRPQEHFLTVALNGAHEVLTVRIVSVGLVNRTLVHPREVFAEAIAERAAAVIVAHNHPSGNTEPSAEDRAVTRTLVEAGDILGVRVLDHIVFTPQGYHSLLEAGEL